jgi:hypothetical protein
MNAGQSGQMGGQAQFLNSIQARGMRAKEEAKLKKREADIEAFLLKNPERRQQYELLNLLGIQSQPTKTTFERFGIYDNAVEPIGSVRKDYFILIQQIQNDQNRRLGPLAGASNNKPAAAIQLYNKAVEQGYTGSLIEFQKEIASDTNFNIGDTLEIAMAKEAMQLGAADIEKTNDALKTSNELVPRLLSAQRILEDPDFETGPVASATLPARRLYADITGIDSKQVNQQDAYQAFANFTVPRMRPPGSGATSDFEARLFQDSTINLANTKKGNQIILGTMLQTVRREKEIAMMQEQYFMENKTTLGFQKYLQDNNLITPLYKEIKSSDQAIDLFNNGLLKNGDVYIDYMTMPSNPQLSIFNEKDIR